MKKLFYLLCFLSLSLFANDDLSPILEILDKPKSIEVDISEIVEKKTCNFGDDKTSKPVCNLFENACFDENGDEKYTQLQKKYLTKKDNAQPF